MKRAPRGWPRSIVEVPARRPDPRSEDTQATQKISRETLDAVLRGTKSGFRPAERSKPEPTGAGESLEEPRDDAPQITITGIHSMEFDAIDPATIAAMSSSFEASSSSSSTGSMRAAASPDRMSAPVTSPVTAFVPIPASKVRNEGAIAHTTPRRSVMTTRLHITRRMAFIAGVVVVVVMTVAGLVGFFAGRLH